MFYYLVWYLLAILRDDGVESALIKFADDTKVGVDVSTSEDGIRIQNDLKTLEKYSQTSKTEFSNNVYKALHEKKKKMKDQTYKYKMQNHRQGGRTAKKKNVRATAGLKANTSKAGKSPERQISYGDVLLHEYHMQQGFIRLCKAPVFTQLENWI